MENLLFIIFSLSLLGLTATVIYFIYQLFLKVFKKKEIKRKKIIYSFAISIILAIISFAGFMSLDSVKLKGLNLDELKVFAEEQNAEKLYEYIIADTNNATVEREAIALSIEYGLETNDLNLESIFFNYIEDLENLTEEKRKLPLVIIQEYNKQDKKFNDYQSLSQMYINRDNYDDEIIKMIKNYNNEIKAKIYDGDRFKQFLLKDLNQKNFDQFTKKINDYYQMGLFNSKQQDILLEKLEVLKLSYENSDDLTEKMNKISEDVNFELWEDQEVGTLQVYVINRLEPSEIENLVKIYNNDNSEYYNASLTNPNFTYSDNMDNRVLLRMKETQFQSRGWQTIFVKASGTQEMVKTDGNFIVEVPVYTEITTNEKKDLEQLEMYSMYRGQYDGNQEGIDMIISELKKIINNGKEFVNENTGDLRQYRNDRYGYSIEYPAYWGEALESQNGDGALLYTSDTIEIRVYRSMIDGDNLLESYLDYGYELVENGASDDNIYILKRQTDDMFQHLKVIKRDGNEYVLMLKHENVEDNTNNENQVVNDFAEALESFSL